MMEAIPVPMMAALVILAVTILFAIVGGAALIIRYHKIDKKQEEIMMRIMDNHEMMIRIAFQKTKKRGDKK